MDEITPYNIPEGPPSEGLGESQVFDSIQNQLQNYRGRINVGAGSYSYHLEKTQGQWMGNDTFASATWSVDMQGNNVANSLTANNASINGSISISNSYTAGESLTAGDSCIVINDFSQDVRDADITDTNKGYGLVAANVVKRALAFTPIQSVTSSEIKSYMAKVGAPADNTFLTIETDSAGAPSGSVITNGTSNNVSGGGLTTTTFVQTTFTFASAFTLTANTKYWIVWQRSGATSNTNYYLVDSINGGLTANKYATFIPKSFNGTSWVDAPNRGANFIITLASGNPSIQAWQTGSDIKALGTWFGFARSTTSAGSTVQLITQGTATLSGLTLNSVYFPGSTAGGVSTTAGTYGVQIGIATSSTALLISPARTALFSKVAKNVNTNYLAETDGFVTCSVVTDSGAGPTLDGLSDTSTTPTTRVAYGRAGGAGTEPSITFPVLKNNYYRVTSTNVASYVMFFYPLY